MILLALPLLIALQAPAEKPKPPTYTAALELAVKVAKTLKCGMTRDEVKAAFVNVRPPEKSFIPKTGEEVITWADVTTYERDGQQCYVNVWMTADPVTLGASFVLCIRFRDDPDHWGERSQDVNQIHLLECREGHKRMPAPK